MKPADQDSFRMQFARGVSIPPDFAILFDEFAGFVPCGSPAQLVIEHYRQLIETFRGMANHSTTNSGTAEAVSVSESSQPSIKREHDDAGSVNSGLSSKRRKTAKRAKDNPVPAQLRSAEDRIKKLEDEVFQLKSTANSGTGVSADRDTESHALKIEPSDQSSNDTPNAVRPNVNGLRTYVEPLHGGIPEVETNNSITNPNGRIVTLVNDATNVNESRDEPNDTSEISQETSNNPLAASEDELEKFKNHMEWTLRAIRNAFMFHRLFNIEFAPHEVEKASDNVQDIQKIIDLNMGMLRAVMSGLAGYCKEDTLLAFNNMKDSKEAVHDLGGNAVCLEEYMSSFYFNEDVRQRSEITQGILSQFENLVKALETLADACKESQEDED